jgi:membrane-bound metal-dependent hydrolase YbcI (DUF457 family)
MTDEDLDERVGIATAAHRVRTAMLFATFVWALLAVVFWVTSTPKRWLALVIAVVCGVGLYAVLR